jgi:heme/copper-type cytochrome/quinol oxidase subunit 2
MKLILAIVLFVLSLFASQILNGASVFAGSAPSLWHKIVATIIVITPIVLAFYWAFKMRNNNDEYQRKVNEQAISNAAISGFLVIMSVQIVHNFIPSVHPANIEIVPSVGLIWFLMTKSRLLKSKLAE